MILKLCGLIAVIVTCHCAPPSQPASAPSTTGATAIVDDGPTRVMTGAVLPALHGLTPVRHHDPDAVVAFTLTMRRRNTNAGAETGPQPVMSREELRAQYASDDEVSVVKEWAARHHLAASNNDNDTIELTGTTRDVEAILRVTINDYSSVNLGEFFANDRDPTIPSSLPVTFFIGLNNAPAARPR